MVNSIVISVKKLGYTIGLLFISFLAFSQTEVQHFERLDTKKVKNDLKIIKAEMDSTLYYINATYHALKEEVELFGWKKTIQMNSDIFLPILIFVALYLLWLKNRD